MSRGNGDGARIPVGELVGGAIELGRKGYRLAGRATKRTRKEVGTIVERRRRAQEARQETFVTVVCDSEAEYVRFTDHVFDAYGDNGWKFTNVPIVTSLRVTPEVFDKTKDQFGVRLVTRQDLHQVKERVSNSFVPAAITSSDGR